MRHDATAIEESRHQVFHLDIYTVHRALGPDQVGLTPCR